VGEWQAVFVVHLGSVNQPAKPVSPCQKVGGGGGGGGGGGHRALLPVPCRVCSPAGMPHKPCVPPNAACNKPRRKNLSVFQVRQRRTTGAGLGSSRFYAKQAQPRAMLEARPKYECSG